MPTSGSRAESLPEVGNLDYAAAKLALLALSTSLATEFSPQGIRSNVVVPGPTRTPLYDRLVAEAARMGQPDDIAQVVAYLVSPLSHQVTAAEWSVDGGAQRHI